LPWSPEEEAGVSKRAREASASLFGEGVFFMQSRPGRIGAEHTAGHTTWVLAPLALLALVGTARAQDAGTRYETVVVTPRESEAPREDEAASASVITRDRTPRSGETLPQLLSELPGVTVVRLGGLGAMATLSLRGSAPSQVAIYVDGVPLNSATWGSVDIGSLPIADLARIEVYRGMSPSAFPSSAIGGVLSLESRTPDETGLSAHGGGGSFGTGFGGAQATWAGRRLRLLVSANYLRSSGDFVYYDDNHTTSTRADDTPDQIRKNNGLRQLDGLVRAAVPLGGRREILTTFSFFGRDKGLPPYGDFEPQGASLGIRRFLGSALYDSRDDLGPGGRLRVTAYGATTEQQLRDLHMDVTDKPTSTRDRSLSVGTTATGSRPVTDWLRLSGTADARHERFLPLELVGTARSAVPGSRSSGALGIEGHLLLGEIELYPSARLEAAHDEVLDVQLGRYTELTRPETYLLPIGRLALVDRRSDALTLRANAGRYARVPTMFERYGNDGRFQGNPQLVPESSWNADAGFAASAGSAEGTGLTVDAAVFASRASELIDLRNGRNVVRAENVRGARILGAELTASGRWGRHARLVGQGTFTDARDTSGVPAYDGKLLPMRPRLRAYARPELRGLPLGWRWRLGAYAEATVASGNYTDPYNATWVRRRPLFGAGASLESPDARWRLVCSAQNLTGADVIDVFGYPQPRRSLFLTLQWTTSGNSSSKETAP
jgi:vitamin B12 transporter